MENLTHKRTLAESPQYFGAYLNMARHNIFTINNHLAEKMNARLHRKRYNILPDEENIPNSFLCNEIKEKPILFYNQLIRFLPIVKIYSNELLPETEKEINKKEGIDFKLLAMNLRTCFIEINDFRNDYTHYYNKTNGTVRKIKISNDLSSFLKTNKDRAIEYTKKRFKDVYQDKHFNLAGKIEVVKPDNTITQEGLVFLTCMFLDREYAFQFVNRISGLKGTTIPEFRATREVLSAFCVKLPHDKFSSDDAEQSFILDVLSELNKCPIELYGNITNEEKRQFQPDIAEKITNIEKSSIPEELPEEKYEDYIKSITTKTRRSDRFSHFALRYLDNNEDFNLLFHLNLGKVLLDTYKKTILGKEEDRDIVEEAKVFGKLKDFEIENEAIRKIDVRNNMLFELYHPYFHTRNNKIGFVFEAKTNITDYNKDENGKWIQKFKYQNPDGFLSLKELPKVLLLELMQKGKVEEIIKSFLNKNIDLILNIDFIEKIRQELAYEKTFNRSFQKKKLSAYNDKGLAILSERKAKLNSILIQYNLNDRQIPSRILDYWLNISDVKDEDEIANKIKAIKKDCKDRIKKFSDEKKRPKIGAMATFLAKDIVNMIIDEGVKNKITSFYYDKVQECIALFSNLEKKKMLIEILEKELTLFDKVKGHPFLSDLDIGNINTTSELYEKYLIKKGGDEKGWINATFYKKAFDEKKKKMVTKIRLPEESSSIPYSIRNLVKEKSDLQKWLTNVNKGCREKDNPKPVDLPTNLFDDTLIEILKARLAEKGIQFDEKDKFSKLYELYRNDTQPFYNAEREYMVYEKQVKFKPGYKKSYKEYFKEVLENVYKEKKGIRDKEREKDRRKPPIQKSDILSVFNNAITQNEKIIRHHQTKDRILIEMINSLIKTGTEPDIKLKDIFPLSDKSPLNQQEVISQKVERALSYDENGELIRNLNDRVKRISKTITDTRKRKDITIFRKLVFDKRLPELFEYYENDIIPYPELDKELDEYNKYKEMVFDKVFELEKLIIEKPGVPEEIRTGTKDNIQHELYLKWLKENELINDEERKFLRIIRNSFSHNQFPPKIIVEKFVKIDINENITKQIIEKYVFEIEKLKEKIKKQNF